MTLFEFFHDHYRPRRLLGKSPETTRLYLMSIRAFGKTLGTVPTLEHLTDTNVVKHLQRLLDEGRSPATANKDRCQLLTLWRFAHRLRFVGEYPSVGALREPERVPTAWMPEDIERLEAAIAKQERTIGDVPAADWWSSLLHTCLDTGERISAMRQARWEWLNGEWLSVPAESRKGKTRDRAYRLRPTTVAKIEAIRGGRQLIWEWPYSPGYLWQKWKAILQAAGLPSGRRDMFHRLRRTTGSYAHAAGLDAQEVLDHEFRRTTRRYLDPRLTRPKQASDILADFLRNPTRRDPPEQRETA